MKQLALRLTAVVAAALLATACIDERCDSDQYFAAGLCFDNVYDARLGDAGAEDATSVPFNTACSDTAQCGGATNFCAVPPGETLGFCTHTGCVEDPGVCTSGTTCLDLTPYGLAGTSICVGGGS